MLLPATSHWQLSPVNPQLPGALVPTTAFPKVLPKLHVTGFARVLKTREEGSSAAHHNASREITRQPPETKPGQGDNGPQVCFELSSLTVQGPELNDPGDWFSIRHGVGGRGRVVLVFIRHFGACGSSDRLKVHFLRNAACDDGGDPGWGRCVFELKRGGPCVHVFV